LKATDKAKAYAFIFGLLRGAIDASVKKYSA
jgi:hypothetical protein